MYLVRNTRHLIMSISIICEIMAIPCFRRDAIVNTGIKKSFLVKMIMHGACIDIMPASSSATKSHKVVSLKTDRIKTQIIYRLDTINETIRIAIISDKLG